MSGRVRFVNGGSPSQFSIGATIVENDGKRCHLKETFTNSDGRFRITEVPIGADVRLEVTNAEQLLFLAATKHKEIRARKQRHDVGDFVVSRIRFAKLRGKIETPEGLPVDSVRLESMKYGHAWDVIPNEEFQIEIPIDATSLSIGSAGLSMRVWDHEHPCLEIGEDVFLAAVELTPCRKVAGTVRSSNGKLSRRSTVLAGARFGATIREGKTHWAAYHPQNSGVASGCVGPPLYLQETQTDENGHFVFENVPNIPLIFLAYAKEELSWERVGIGEKVVALTLEACGWASGTVKNSASLPDHAVVSLSSSGKDPAGVFEACRVLCKLDGRFAAPLLPQGTYTIDCYMPSHGLRLGWSEQSIVIEPGCELNTDLELFGGCSVELTFHSTGPVGVMDAWLRGDSACTSKPRAVRCLVVASLGATTSRRLAGSFSDVPNGSYELKARCTWRDEDGWHQGRITKMVNIKDDGSGTLKLRIFQSELVEAQLE